MLLAATATAMAGLTPALASTSRPANPLRGIAALQVRQHAQTSQKTAREADSGEGAHETGDALEVADAAD
ncbi:MAG TPA: hypothetical protein VH298_06575, partial [Jatrophihabitans sp.]|nr:hypothetical protein [Jatrophihabitans sp.]